MSRRLLVCRKDGVINTIDCSRQVVVAFLSLILASMVATGAAKAPSDIYNCSDFECQEDAQDVFE